jgi:hypothetical protein
MDVRIPEYAVHTWQGFSTGKWEGNILTTYTTRTSAGMDAPQRAASSDRISLWIISSSMRIT